MQKPIPTPSDSEIPARPKVMRRPAHFAGPSNALVAIPDEHASPHHSEKIASYSHISWQEDGHFGLALVGIVLLVNLLLLVGLPRAKLPPASAEIAAQVPVVEPVALGVAPQHEVTLYAPPTATDTRSLSSILSLHSAENAAPALSVTPEEMPMPKARPLDQAIE